MDKNSVKKIIIENQQRIPGLKIFSRTYTFETEANYIITGQRRAGKTYLLYYQIQQLLQKGFPVQGILYISFEDERLLEMDASGLDQVLEAYHELFEHTPVLFFDEIQNVPGWQNFVRRLADTDHRIYVTGSNAQMLSGEMASALGGRFMIKEIDTLSFTEYLSFHGIQVAKNTVFSAQRFDIQRAFESYFYYGGFPETIKFTDKKEYLTTLFQKVFLGDIITRHQIRNPFAIRLLIKKLAESTMDEVSFNRMRNIISSTGVRVGTATLIEYMDYLKEAYLIDSLANFQAKITDRESRKKYYFRDTGIVSLFLTEPESILLETLVHNHLRRNYPGNVYYFRDTYEVDFYVPGRVLVQACYSLKDYDTRKREITTLQKAAGKYLVRKQLIITWSDEETISAGSSEIQVIPAWKWLLASV